ncbi:MAG: DUF58 domain-containing protein [Saprospiraceae bacterium]|nr:DUF58 domain-containing protein [Saprospiraceae bacterium]MCF8248960.1 DUF58 domain-containing protein [Saprospiraceae bacterium]MCF8279171.1 DUF58 domain-containing protein [Bacteroidales bacterium]MCF8310854.1 DUF58 domain-containing protein [Saprospiraceae bacterium]MCF8439558.1 DUF58 domain-containing protein [Saprospiraceae bacterium]
MRNLYLSDRFFLLFGLMAVLFALGYVVPTLYPVAIGAFCVVVALVLADVILLFGKNVSVTAERKLPKLLSLSDENTVELRISNLSPRPLRLTVIDELPVQFQIRDFEQKIGLHSGESQSLGYELRPLTRGEYSFGVANIFAATKIGLVQRRFQAAEPMEVPVYPSVIQMKHYELLAFNRTSAQEGLRKIRRIGHSYEFDQIKNYVLGDDYRSINWKATSRQSKLMVNMYEDERSQQVYCIIDKSRSMKMPFNGLSLLDYAINTSLAISNIVLKKYDRAGLITFSDKIGSTIKADRKANQLNKILHALYNEKERPLEANYELLYHIARKLITGRSLILLYTNFESMYALERVLPMLRRINAFHLLVVVFFENTEIQDFVKEETKTIEAIYTQTMAQNYLAEKSAMAYVLRQHGIQTILTRPEDLSMNTINKYLELKSRGMI